jgi:hypothetical protein
MGKNAVQVDAEINIMNILLAFTGSSYDQYWRKWPECKIPTNTDGMELVIKPPNQKHLMSNFTAFRIAVGFIPSQFLKFVI